MTAMTMLSKLKKHIRFVLIRKFPLEIVYTLIASYTVQQTEGLRLGGPTGSQPYFGTTSFGRKYLRLIPEEILERPVPDSGSAGTVRGMNIRFEEKLPAKARSGVYL